MTKPLTQEQFIDRSTKKHNGFYNYTLSVYVRRLDEIIIICPLHGEFKQAAGIHMGGCGCPKCGGTVKLTQEEFVDKSNKKHNGYYNYSLSVYIKNDLKIIIICPKHGEFEQTPIKHMMGRGCRACAIEKNNIKKMMGNEEIDRIVFDKNIRRLEDSMGGKKKINFQCQICDYIWPTSPCTFYRKNSGCPRCSGKTALDPECVKKKLLDKNIILLSEYKNTIIKSEVKCLNENCGHIWPVRLAHILHSNSGCPMCNKAGLVNEKIVRKYLKNNKIDFIPEHYIKINGDKWIFVDYYIEKFNLIIEYNGLQHYHPVCFGGMSQEEAEKQFIKQQSRDSMLRQYCLDKKINLVEIDGRYYKHDKLIKYLESLEILQNIKKVA